MGYSTNPITVERNLPYLQHLTGGEVRFRTDKPRWLAGKLRECLAILRENPELAPTVQRDYRVEIASSREVIASPKDAPKIEVISQKSKTTVQTQATYGPADIITQWGRHVAVSIGPPSKLHFASANLSKDQLYSLWEWAQDNGVMFFEAAGALTLMPHDSETAPFAWSPNDG